MPRSARASAGGYCYHVINRGNARAEVFHKEEDLAAFVRIMGESCIRVPMRVVAYSLMPNHFPKEPRRNKMSKLELFLFHESGIRSVCRMPLKSKGFDASSRHCSLSWTSACAVNGRQRKRTRLVGVALVV